MHHSRVLRCRWVWNFLYIYIFCIFYLFLLLAKEYELSLNLSSDPCDDFYSFSCGGWLERNPVDSTSISHSQLDEVSAKIGAELRGIKEYI